MTYHPATLGIWDPFQYKYRIFRNGDFHYNDKTVGNTLTLTFTSSVDTSQSTRPTDRVDFKCNCSNVKESIQNVSDFVVDLASTAAMSLNWFDAFYHVHAYARWVIGVKHVNSKHSSPTIGPGNVFLIPIDTEFSFERMLTCCQWNPEHPSELQ